MQHFHSMPNGMAADPNSGQGMGASAPAQGQGVSSGVSSLKSRIRSALGGHTVTRGDLWALKYELIVVVATFGLFFVALSATPWEVVLPLCAVVLSASAILVAGDVIHLVRLRKAEPVMMVLLVLDSVVVASSIGILYFWDELQDGAVDGNLSSVAYGLDALMLIVSVVTLLGRLVLRVRERRRTELEAEMLGDGGITL